MSCCSSTSQIRHQPYSVAVLLIVAGVAIFVRVTIVLGAAIVASPVFANVRINAWPTFVIPIFINSKTIPVLYLECLRKALIYILAPDLSPLARRV